MLKSLITVVILLLSSAASAGAIETFGRYYQIELDSPLGNDSVFNVAFDVDKGAEPGQFSRAINSAARLNNMLLAHGVSEDNIRLAVVLHGSATYDAQAESLFFARTQHSNASEPLIKALLEQGVRVIVCGQSATHMGVSKAQLIPGVEMALSAMAAHAQLQQQGYTLNPF